MSKQVCLKCGSTHVDDGTNYVVSISGVVLFSVGLSILVMSSTAGSEVLDWMNYSPLEGQAPGVIIPIVLAISIAEYLVINGTTRSERVRCRKCGTIWTPPRTSLKARKG